MKADTVLDFAVFQLTPTRTRCELLISAKGVAEKLASGLLRPFLSHLRAAEEQIAVGGYSIRLEPPVDGKQNKASWFTKSTMQRFVRFVSTPEVLERVSAVETELILLEEELSNYTHEGDDQHSVSGSVVGKCLHKAGKYQQSRNDPLQDLETDATESSKSRLMKAMEARQSMLQREQGMAFARAIAAGFDMDHVSDLISFAEYFGATRLREACLKFTALCKKQQEGGLWLNEMELVAAEAAFSYSDTNGTGITIAPAGMDRDVADEESKLQDDSSIKGVDDLSRKESIGSHQRFPSIDRPDHQNFTHMMGMPAGQIPYPWMQFGTDQGYDPRFFPQNIAGGMPMPQNPYVNGNYGPMNPYWSQDNWRGPQPGPYNANLGNAHAQDEDEPVEKNTSRKNGRKSASPRRRTSSPLKRIQVGRGKRSGMVLIRNINYITSQESSAATKNRSTGSERNDSDEASEFESSSGETYGPQEKHEHNHSENDSGRKKTRRKKSVGGEVSSEDSQFATGANKKEDEMAVGLPERSTLHSAAAGIIDFGSELFADQHAKKPSKSATNDSFILDGGRGYESTKSSTQYEFDDQMKSVHRNLTSGDGMLLPQRNANQAGNAADYDSELVFRKTSGSDQEKRDVDDSFIIPQRGGKGEVYEDVYQLNNAQSSYKETPTDEFFIVPSRTHDGTDMTRRTLELEMPEQLYAEPKEKSDNTPKFEPDDIWMLPERSIGKESLERRWNDFKYDMEVMASMQSKPEAGAGTANDADEEGSFYEQYREHRDAKFLKESGSKRAEREAKMKSLQDTLDTRKAEIAARFKTTRSSILKTKKEKEDEERKRIEDLAMQRRNRIAARTGGNTTGSTPRPQLSSSRTNVISKTPASTQRISSTPSATRGLSSISTNKDRKTPASRNPLTRSVPSFVELRKENTKPTTTRLQDKVASKSKSQGLSRVSEIPLGTKKTVVPSSLQDRKPKMSTRKSIATVRELKNPETSAFQKAKPVNNDENRPVLRKNKALESGAASGLPKVSETPVLDRPPLQKEQSKSLATSVHADIPLKTAASEDHIAPIVKSSERITTSSNVSEKAKVADLKVLAPGNNASQVASFSNGHLKSSIALNPNSSSSSSHLQHLSTEIVDSQEPRSEIAPSYAPAIGSYTDNLPKLKHYLSTEKVELSQLPEKEILTDAQQAKDPSKGFKRLLKFGRKSRPSTTTDSVLAPEGDDDGDDDHRGKLEEFGSSKPGSETGGDCADSNGNGLKSFVSSIPAPPADFKLRDDRISGSSLVKAPRSFFSLNFRTKEAKVRA